MKYTLITCALLALLSVHCKGQDIPPKDFWPPKVKFGPFKSAEKYAKEGFLTVGNHDR